MSSGGTIIYIIVCILLYVYAAYCLMRIADNTGTENSWFAWIPILNLWLITKIADKDVLWFILLLIPCVNIIVAILIFMDIAEVLGYERWWGILMIVPILNLYVLYKFAFQS